LTFNQYFGIGRKEEKHHAFTKVAKGKKLVFLLRYKVINHFIVLIARKQQKQKMVQVIGQCVVLRNYNRTHTRRALKKIKIKVYLWHKRPLKAHYPHPSRMKFFPPLKRANMS
jgi:hypothetical protein